MTNSRPTARKNIKKLPYIPGLDGLRAFAVFAVIFYHMGLFGHLVGFWA